MALYQTQSSNKMSALTNLACGSQNQDGGLASCAVTPTRPKVQSHHLTASDPSPSSICKGRLTGIISATPLREGPATDPAVWLPLGARPGAIAAVVEGDLGSWDVRKRSGKIRSTARCVTQIGASKQWFMFRRFNCSRGCQGAESIEAAVISGTGRINTPDRSGQLHRSHKMVIAGSRSWYAYWRSLCFQQCVGDALVLQGADRGAAEERPCH